MTEKQWFYILMISLVALLFLSIPLAIWRTVNKSRSYNALPLGKMVNKTVACYYPLSTYQYLFYTFFNPKDLRFSTYYGFLAIYTSIANIAIGLIAVAINAIILIYRLLKEYWMYEHFKRLMLVLELSDTGLRLARADFSPAKTIKEVAWSDVKQVFVYRHYIKLIADKDTFYAFYDRRLSDVRDKVAMHFLRDSANSYLYENPKIEQQSQPNTAQHTLFCILSVIIGPIMGIILYFVNKQKFPTQSLIYLLLSFLAPALGILITVISKL